MAKPTQWLADAYVYCEVFPRNQEKLLLWIIDFFQFILSSAEWDWAENKPSTSPTSFDTIKVRPAKGSDEITRMNIERWWKR